MAIQFPGTPLGGSVDYLGFILVGAALIAAALVAVMRRRNKK